MTHAIRWNCLLAAAAFLLFAADQLNAQPLTATEECIEATVVNADLVFVGTIVAIKNEPDAKNANVWTCTVDADRTLKQGLFDNESQPSWQVEIARSRGVVDDWRKQSAKLLIAHQEYSRDLPTVIDLTPGKLAVWKADFTLLREPDEVLRAAEEAISQAPANVKRFHTFRLQVPQQVVADTKWNKYARTGGHLRLLVPVNDELLKRAERALDSDSYSEREEGARALRYFKSDASIAKLKTLLNDPGWAYLTHPQQNNGVGTRIYGVRQAAYEALTIWGEEVERPVIREEFQESAE